MVRYWVFLLPFLLAGCIMPTAFTVASLVANGTSYLTTGKSVADHGISAVADQDCAMWRVIKGAAICQPSADVETAVAMNSVVVENIIGDMAAPTPMPPETKDIPTVWMAMQATDRSWARANVPSLHDSLAVAPAAGVEQPRLLRPVMPVSRSTDRYIVLGSFTQRGNADLIQRRHAGYDPTIMAVYVDGRRYYRVVSGPFKRAELAERRRLLQAAGIHNPWTIKGCKDGAPPIPTCLALPHMRDATGRHEELAAVATWSVN